MNKAAGIWQLHSTCLGSSSDSWKAVRNVVGNALFECWPRTFTAPASHAKIQMKVDDLIKVEPGQDADQAACWVLNELRKNHRWPFDIFVVATEELCSNP